METSQRLRNAETGPISQVVVKIQKTAKKKH